MKILAVTPWVSGPRRPRSYGLLEDLATRHDVTVVAACWSEQDLQDLESLQVQRTRAVPLSKWRGAARAGLGVVGRRSLQQSYLDDPALRRAIRDEAERWKPDLSYFNVLRTAQFANEVPGPRIIDLDEFRSRYYEQLRSGSRSPQWRLLGRIEAPRMRAAEEEAIEAFDRLVVSSPTDLDRAVDRCRLVRSPHQMRSAPTVGCGGPAADRDEPGRPRIVFVGRLSYRANVEAVRWFAERVLPTVVRAHPDVVLDIVGESPHRSLRRLAGPNVDVVGPVPEVAPYYARAHVSVVPVFLATGVQMKLIESLSLGVATVTTGHVARLAGIDGPGPCLLADDPEEWAAAVSRLLSDHGVRSEVAIAGERWAAEHYDDSAISASLHATIGELTDPARSSEAAAS